MSLFPRHVRSGILPWLAMIIIINILSSLRNIADCVYLISMHYKRYEVQLRITFFFSGSIIAGGISGVSANPHFSLSSDAMTNYH
jgi:hypothetical protein